MTVSSMARAATNARGREQVDKRSVTVFGSHKKAGLDGDRVPEPRLGTGRLDHLPGGLQNTRNTL